ncbi:hypothetical protein ACRAR1_06995 [Streptomyces sanyensis]|uniref:hypothetical protein n=1 Tax=Streptomyces sanyensis TaxID=568869 RepID=UPI003D77AD14
MSTTVSINCACGRSFTHQCSHSWQSAGQHARGFRLHLYGGEVLHGVQWPDGRALVVDDPEAGLATAAVSVQALLAGGYHGARLEWAPAPTTPEDAS